MRDQCFTQRMDEETLFKLESIIKRRRVPRGEFAYQSGDSNDSLFFIHEGFFKECDLNDEGEECIVGFHMAGDVMGLECIADGAYSSHAVAVQDSTVCEMPFQALQALSLSDPALQQALYRILSREVAHNKKSMMLLGSLPAEERLLAFLHTLSQQFAARGVPASAFELPMSRQEIAGFLGLQMETVSRAFTKLHADGLINVRRRYVRIDAPIAA
jgi:CRP/FNR family transcriptional regulator